MKKAFRRNWFPKVVSLLLAIAIWFLISDYLRESQDGGGGGKFFRSGSGAEEVVAPRAIEVAE